MLIPTHLLPTRLPRKEHAVTDHFFKAPQGVMAENLSEPSFWVHMARGFKVDDTITAIAADGSFDGELRVVALDPRGLWAQVRVLRMLKSEAVVRPVERWPDADGWSIEFSGPQRWRVLDRIRNVVAADLPDEQSAIAALAALKPRAVDYKFISAPGEGATPAPAKESAAAKRAPYVRKERIATGEYEIGWAGPFHKFRIIDPGGKTAAKGFDTREEAEAALVNLREARAA